MMTWFKIAGVTFGNRQRFLRDLHIGQTLYLQREPSNPHDKNAIKIVNASNAHLGYVPKEEAKWLAPLIDRGCRFTLRVYKFTYFRQNGVVIYGAIVELSPSNANSAYYLSNSKQGLVQGSLQL